MYWSAMLDTRIDPDTRLLYHGRRANPCGKILPEMYQTRANLKWKFELEFADDPEYEDWFF